jgi:hypothetical protein
MANQKSSIIKADKLNLKYSDININTAPRAFNKLNFRESALIFFVSRAKYIASIKNTPTFPRKSKIL